MPRRGYHPDIVSLFLRVAYDGTAFSGFARQADRPDGRPIRTVQGQLEAAIEALYGEPVRTRGASRTDAGVHARGQLVAFDPPTAIPPSGVMAALDDRLPADLTITAAWHDAATDPRRGNLGKHYRYQIRCTRAGRPGDRSVRVALRAGPRSSGDAERRAAAAGRARFRELSGGGLPGADLGAPRGAGGRDLAGRCGHDRRRSGWPGRARP